MLKPDEFNQIFYKNKTVLLSYSKDITSFQCLKVKIE